MSSPLTGVAADWVGKVTGNDHEGQFYNLVSRAYCTTTRATPKTIYDPLTGRIHDVRAGYLAVNPWGAYKTSGVGVAPVIEEARTNYLVNSYGAVDTNADGRSDRIQDCAGVTFTRQTSPVYGIEQRMVATGAPLSVGFGDGAADAYVVAGESVTLSSYIRGTSTSHLHLIIDCFGSAWEFLGEVKSAEITPTVSAVRHSVTYSDLPAGAWLVSNNLNGDAATFDIGISAQQLEKDSSATSYIPTTTAAVTRNADVLPGFASLTPDADCGFVVRTASLADNTASVDAITGTVAASLLNRAAQRVVLFPTGRTAGEITALNPLIDGYYEYADVVWTNTEGE